MANREVKQVKKRKKDSEDASEERQSKRKQLDPLAASEDLDKKITNLETAILKSQKNYNSINELLEYAKDTKSSRTQGKARLALCGIFSHFLAEGKITSDVLPPKQDNVIGRWLAKRYEQYCDLLLQDVYKGFSLASKLLMQMVKEETSIAPTNQIWTTGLYFKLIEALLCQHGSEVHFEDFAAEHIFPHKDTEMYACKVISSLAQLSSPAVDVVISFLSLIRLPSKDEEEEEESFLATIPRPSKRKRPSDTAFKKTLEEVWLVVLRKDLTPAQRRQLLDLVPETIAPWFSKPEMLTDFLVDSFNAGGAESMTALSGMFYLIQERNLDYPQFYTKVYSMIDQYILHSKQRSRFLRLMMIFLASTHLPAALVASFMKRLSRLCLYASPSAIIAIVPWLYNMIKEHPVCAFMIQRTSPKTSTKLNNETIGADPFNANETDPMQTHAIDSSLWEIETLSTHYHPNVATIASIISKPFTKLSYKVEDFLDYTYDGMLESELSRNLKKTPVVEFQIPKRIFTRDPAGLHDELPLLTRMWEFK